MSNLLNIKDQNGNWIPIPVVTNGIQSITQNQDYTLTITLNDGTTYTTTSIKGEDGQDYILTEQDKQEIAGLVDTPVDDVQINGTSIVNDGVAEIPVASSSQLGAVKILIRNGVYLDNTNALAINRATSSQLKNGDDGYRPITPYNQHESTFYGLAKASGDTTQSQSDNEVGIYTDEAKASIKNMLGVEDVDIDSKASVITETISGDIVSFDDGADMPLQSLVVDINPVQDLHGYDSPWPAGGGKNLLQTTATSKTENGITFTVNPDGSVLVNGTATEQANFIVNPDGKLIPAGTQVTVSGCPANGSMDTYSFWATTQTYIEFGDSVTFTPSNDTLIAGRIRIANGCVCNNLLFKPQVEKSPAKTSWSPYSNVCPISGWTGANVQRTGVNVWDEEWEVGQINVDTGENLENPRGLRTKNYISVQPECQYFAYISNVTKRNLKTRWYGKNKEYIGSDPSIAYGAVFTVPAGAYYLRFVTQNEYGTTYNHDISINYPATDTEYHPYTGQTYPITFPTEAGTVYGGTLDVTTGELVVDWSEKIFSGEKSEGWDKQETYNYFITSIISDAINANAAADNFKSNTYPYGNIMNMSATLGGCLIWGSVRVRLADMSISLDDWKNMLSETPLQVCYRLAGPITIQLTPNQVNSLLGVNNLWADTGDSTVTYRADTTMYINRKIAEAISALS